MKIGASSYVSTIHQTTTPSSTRHIPAADPAVSATQVSISSAGMALAQGTLIPIDMSRLAVQKLDPAIEQKLKEMFAAEAKRYSPQGISNYEQGMINAGNERQTAVIRLNGKIVGSFNEHGSFFASNAMGASLSGANGDQAAMAKMLKDKYGSSVDIQTFAPGSGPTWAQLEKSMYGTDYFSRIPALVSQYRQEATNWLQNNPMSFGS